ncbi:hypothetical protein ACFX2I_006733 [Malus domestica]
MTSLPSEATIELGFLVKRNWALPFASNTFFQPNPNSLSTVFQEAQRESHPSSPDSKKILQLALISGTNSVVHHFVSLLDFIMTVLPTSSTKSILHQVPEGHVGVYWRGCALLKTITDPGFHLKLPLVTHFEPIQVTLQTDQVRDIPCGTKGCVMINFEKIEWWVGDDDQGGLGGSPEGKW